MKAYLILLYKDQELWNYEAVDMMLDHYNVSKDSLDRWLGRFWLMEASVNGLLEIVEEKYDDGSYFKEDSVVTKYRVTKHGLDDINYMLG